MADALLAGVILLHRRLLCGENVCHEHTKVDDVVGEKQPKVDGNEFGMLLPASSKTDETGEHDPCTCTDCFRATHPKNEMMASAIQHAIPTKGIADIALSSPERKIDAGQCGLARWAKGVTRIRRTIGNIEGISNAKNTTSNDSQDRYDNSGLYCSGKR